MHSSSFMVSKRKGCRKMENHIRKFTHMEVFLSFNCFGKSKVQVFESSVGSHLNLNFKRFLIKKISSLNIKTKFVFDKFKCMNFVLEDLVLPLSKRIRTFIIAYTLSKKFFKLFVCLKDKMFLQFFLLQAKHSI